jgi:hypothetical protein
MASDEISEEIPVKMTRLLAFLCVLAIVVAACGGGEGDVTTTAAVTGRG